MISTTVAASKTTVLAPPIPEHSLSLKHIKEMPCRQNISHKDESGLVLLPQTIPALLVDQARLRPNNLAIDSYETRMSYAQLIQEVIATSALLHDKGVQAGQKLGICFHLSARAVVTILAILHLGGAVVAVDPLHPLVRRLTMLKEAEIDQLVIGDSNYNEEYKNDFSVIDLSGLEFHRSRKPSDVTTIVAKPNDVAFIPFTSGSTGKPKGILQSHNSLVTMSMELARKMQIDETSRVAHFHPYIFDVSIMEISMTLATGATLCISRREDMMLPAPGEVSHQLTRSGITHVTLSPTMLNTMNPSEVPTVRVLCVMGEALGRSAITKWHSRPERSFLQLWGCTEACILQSMTPPITNDSAPQNIGRAMEDVCRLWIVNPDNVNELQPHGTIGELVVESRALAQGYLNRAGETEEAFLDEVAWKPKASQGKFYRTGDLARENEDGSLYFPGRLDKQMNYHGERIELGEIDFYLDKRRPNKHLDCFSDFDDPSQTVVGFICGIAEDTQGSDLLIPWSDATMSKADAARMTAELKNDGELPAYMIPQFWLPIRRRPLTASGKTDRACLRQLLRMMSAAEWSNYDVSKGQGTSE